MYLFDRVSYRIGDEEIEGYNYPGITTLKGLVSYPRNSKENLIFFWSDDPKNENSNEGFSDRKNYLGSANRKFSEIPLEYVFRYCENYKKVVYEVKHALTLRRSDTFNAVFKTDEKGANQQDKVVDGKITIAKLIWKTPAYKLSDEYKIKLYRQIRNKILPIPYFNRQLEQTIAGSRRPRYIILVLQTKKGNSHIRSL